MYMSCVEHTDDESNGDNAVLCKLLQSGLGGSRRAASSSPHRSHSNDQKQ